MIPNKKQYRDDASYWLRLLSAGLFQDEEHAASLLEQLAEEGTFEAADLVAADVRGASLHHMHSPGMPWPDLAQMSRALRHVWGRIPIRPLRVYFASTKTIRRFGGSMPGRIISPDSIGHDLALAAVFYSVVDYSLPRASWLPEERLPDVYRQVKPDAVIADAEGPRALFEVCGCYTEARLSRLFEYSEETQLPLFLWTCAESEVADDCSTRHVTAA